MQLNKKNAKFVKEVLTEWEKDNILPEDIYKKLISNINIVKFDFKKLSKWCFIFAIFSFFISLTGLGGIFFKEKIFRIVIGAALSCIFYYVGFKDKSSTKKLSKEFFIFGGVLTTAWFVAEIGTFSVLKNFYGSIFFLTACLYGVIAYYGKSNLVLIFSILSLGSWFGGEIGYMSGYATYFLGMSQPLNFVFFGLILIGLSFLTKKVKSLIIFDKTIISIGLLYLFVSLWILSIFGYRADFEYDSSNLNLFIWSFLFLIASLVSIYYGIKEDIYILRGYGIVFLFINLYTKYFEYFWNNLHKTIFFLILSLSLYLIAKKAENMWIFTEKMFGEIKEN